jgi:LPS-assembly protein
LGDYLLMINGRKNSLKYSSAWFLNLLMLLITLNVAANYTIKDKFDNSLRPFFQDTTPRNQNRTDTVPVKKDSAKIATDTFSVKLSHDSLDAPVTYEAEDSVVMLVPEKKIVMYSDAKVKKQDMELTADSIELDQAAKLVTATYRKDTLGNIVGRPKMVQGESTMQADVIQYNIETQKGLTHNAITQQGEMYVQGEKIKKVSLNEYFALRGQFTTCNLDTPHFAFRTKKMKLVNQKLAVSGPIHPEFEGVPVPIYLPFGFFPLSQGRHSGFLPPQFTASDQFGLGLQGLGYYKVLNDFFDVTLRGDIYSYGGWAMYFTPNYVKRYRYRGGMNFTMQRTRILSNDPKQEFLSTRTFNIQWNHTVDSKARPGTSFSANVNAGSTKFNQLVVNNPMKNFTNQLSSSIAYSKTWDTRYNLTLSANHNQNNNTRLINITLPNAAFTVNTFYPLQSKEFVGTPKWYEKLGIGLNSAFSNQLSFYDSAFSFRNILDTMQWGAQHSVPISLSLPAMGPLQVAPGVSFQQRWYSKKMIRTWSDAHNKLDTTFQNGFFLSNDVSFGISLSTALFGTFNRFGKNSSLKAIRHVIRPSVSLNYKPDLASADWQRVRVNAQKDSLQLSYFERSLYGPFSPGTFGGISFSLDNNLEAKVRSRKDTADGGIKKIRLIDGFGVAGSYNLMADSFALSPLSVYLRSTLFDKINITAGASIDPYKVGPGGRRLNQYAWVGNGFTLGRVTNGNIAISTNFQSKAKDQKKQQEKEQVENENLPPMTMEEQLAQLQYVQQNPAEFADFNIQWSLNVSYSLSFSSIFRSDYSGYETVTHSSFNWNGDFNLTPRWKVGMNGFYDFKTSSIQTLTMFISREMHCWQLSINVTPVGLYRSFNITINPKSGLLRDLRINRTRYFYGS